MLMKIAILVKLNTFPIVVVISSMGIQLNLKSIEIKKVAVLGTGVMGSQIAAHLTNVNIEVYAFDMTQEVAIDGIEKCKKLKPGPFYNIKSSD